MVLLMLVLLVSALFMLVLLMLLTLLVLVSMWVLLVLLLMLCAEVKAMLLVAPDRVRVSPPPPCVCYSQVYPSQKLERYFSFLDGPRARRASAKKTRPER